MAKKCFAVIHHYEVGGQQVPIPEQEVIALFSNKKAADNFVLRYSKEHAYGSTYYGSIHCGKLEVEERDLYKHEYEVPFTDFWWLR